MALATTAALAGPPTRCPVAENASLVKNFPAPELFNKTAKIMKRAT